MRHNEVQRGGVEGVAAAVSEAEMHACLHATEGGARDASVWWSGLAERIF